MALTDTVRMTDSPEYPRLAKRMGYQGTVKVRILVAADGTPARVDVLSSSRYHCLDEAAVKAVRQWRFIPARREGRAIESSVEYSFRFVLQYE
ncbi:MAG: energy transducer TonB [Planctomycetes bacterium]|nr:energy transducer TonB [Planctomycetota bacterium]